MAGNQQFLQTSSSAYTVQSLTAPVSAPASKQLLVQSVSAYNATAAENAMGIFTSIATSQFKVWQLRATDAEVTSALQAGTATTIFSTTNNDGVLYQSKDKFNMVAFNVAQASTGSPVYTYKYWNGSAFTDLTLLNTPLYSTTGIKAIVFNAPADWAVGCGTEDADQELYSLQVIATTAPSQAVTFNSIKVCKMLKYGELIAPGASINLDFDAEPYLLQVGETIIPFFSYTNSLNRLDLTYKIHG